MPVTFHRLDQMLAPRPRDEIVAGLLATGEICILSGPPGCGKSALAVTLAGAIADGAPFLGIQTAQGAVAYIALEKAPLANTRLTATGCRRDRVAFAEGTLALRDEEEVERLVQELKRFERSLPETLALIIIDTLGRAMIGAEENSSRDAGQVVAALDLIGRSFPSAALLVIHHTSKGEGNSLRGSSALLAGCDVELTVETKSRRRALRVRKANAIPDGLEISFVLRSVQTPDGKVALAFEDDGPASSNNENTVRKSPVDRLIGLVPAGGISRADLRSAAGAAKLLGPTQGGWNERLRKLLKRGSDEMLLGYDEAAVWLLERVRQD